MFLCAFVSSLNLPDLIGNSNNVFNGWGSGSQSARESSDISKISLCSPLPPPTVIFLVLRHWYVCVNLTIGYYNLQIYSKSNPNPPFFSVEMLCFRPITNSFYLFRQHSIVWVRLPRLTHGSTNYSSVLGVPHRTFVVCATEGCCRR